MTREQMAQAILDLVAGQEAQPSFFAQADALATGIGAAAALSGGDLSEALQYLDALHDGMRDHIVKHWEQHEIVRLN